MTRAPIPRPETSSRRSLCRRTAIAAVVASLVALQLQTAQAQTTPSGLGVPPPPELPKFLDDRRLLVIEDAAKPRLAAEEMRRAEKLKRKAIEADVKRKAEEMRRAVDAAAQTGVEPVAAGTIVDILKPAQAVAAPIPPAARPASQPPAIRATAAPTITLPKPALAAEPPGGHAGGVKGLAAAVPLPGGRVRIDVTEPCRRGEPVTVRYAPYLFIRNLDDGGRLSFVLDLFQGSGAPISVLYQDGETRDVAVGETDIHHVSKVAVVWGKPVDLDLHVFEYAAAHGSAGHVWAQAPRSAETALEQATLHRRGRGFVSFSSNGTEPGHQVEVYTLWMQPGQTLGMVTTALDYATRGTAPAGEHCGTGSLAQIPFETIALAPGRPPIRERGMLAAARCGEPLVEKARFQDDAVADLPLLAQ